MKLKGSKDLGIKTETNATDEIGFSLSKDDEHVIFGMLRNQIYKNPIRAICRELISNARDTQRSVGKGDVPCEVYIGAPPIWLSGGGTVAIFRDYGEGMSPERVDTVYSRYGASTKRHSDKLTGGFGLGAKTPFAYTDMYNFVTVHDGTKYFYSSYIDESQKGKIALLQTEETEEPNGTQIIVPIKPEDQEKFEKYVVTSSLFWETKPKITGFKYHPNYPDLRELKAVKDKANDYKLVAKNDRYLNHDVVAVIDGIVYELEPGLLDFNKSSYKKSCLALFYENGILSIGAHRESIQYDDNTKKVIKNDYEFILDEIEEEILIYINKSKNLIEANIRINLLSDSIRTYSMTLSPEENRLIALSSWYKTHRNIEKFAVWKKKKVCGKFLGDFDYDANNLYLRRVQLSSIEESGDFKFDNCYNRIDPNYRKAAFYYADGALTKARMITLKEQYKDDKNVERLIFVHKKPIRVSRYSRDKDKEKENLHNQREANILAADKKWGLSLMSKVKGIRGKAVKKVTRSISGVVAYHNNGNTSKNIYHSLSSPMKYWVRDKVEVDKATGRIVMAAHNDRPYMYHTMQSLVKDDTINDGIRCAYVAATYYGYNLILINEKNEKVFHGTRNAIDSYNKIGKKKLRSLLNVTCIHKINQQLDKAGRYLPQDKLKMFKDLATRFDTTDTSKKENTWIADLTRDTYYYDTYHVLEAVKATRPTINPTKDLEDLTGMLERLFKDYFLINAFGTYSKLNDRQKQHFELYMNAVDEYNRAEQIKKDKKKKKNGINKTNKQSGQEARKETDKSPVHTNV